MAKRQRRYLALFVEVDNRKPKDGPTGNAIAHTLEVLEAGICNASEFSADLVELDELDHELAWAITLAGKGWDKDDASYAQQMAARATARHVLGGAKR